MPKKSKPLVIVVEDEKDLASMVSEQLEVSGMDTQVFHNAEDTLEYLKDNPADLVLLDVTLPDSKDFELFKKIKVIRPNITVMFLTGNDSEMDKVVALDMGGEDYMVKPFGFPELLARINRLLRRTKDSKMLEPIPNLASTEDSFFFNGAEIFPHMMEICFSNGKRRKVGRKELGIILCFINHPNMVLTRESLIHTVWGGHADVKSRSLDQYIVKIRDYFAQNECDLDELRTIHGVGYIYECND